MIIPETIFFLWHLATILVILLRMYQVKVW